MSTPISAAPTGLASYLTTQAVAQTEALEYIKKRRSGEITSLTTPWQKFNDMHVDGIEMGRIITVAGMSGSGKSLIINQLCSELHALNPHDSFAILNFNFEMASREILLRHVISKSGLTNKELLSANGVMLGDQEMLRVEFLLSKEQANTSIYYCEYPKTVAQYVKICREFSRVHNKKVIFTSDHSVLFRKSDSERSATEMLYALGDASIELKKEIDCTQLHISQLNREIEDEHRKMKKKGANYPIKGDLFGGDALFMCADTVMVNHRPILMNFPANSYGPDGFACGPTDIYWHFLKLRQGDPGIAHMRADFGRFKIYDKVNPPSL